MRRPCWRTTICPPTWRLKLQRSEIGANRVLSILFYYNILKTNISKCSSQIGYVTALRDKIKIEIFRELKNFINPNFRSVFFKHLAITYITSFSLWCIFRVSDFWWCRGDVTCKRRIQQGATYSLQLHFIGEKNGAKRTREWSKGNRREKYKNSCTEERIIEFHMNSFGFIIDTWLIL